MMRCPITYEELSSGRYSKTGLHRLNPALHDLRLFPFDRKAQLQEARKRMSKMSIAGLQPKLSAQLSIKDQVFQPVNKHGSFILKPQHPIYEEVPQNEDLTMRMAKICKIDIPLHGLIYAKDNSMLYFIRRFDRTGISGKIHVEDFAQVAGKTRETKYDYSMEKLVFLIEDHCTFPMIEKLKLFRRILFCWLCGNEDMHLKNFSLIHREEKIELSPAYDLVNTSIAVEDVEEEMALPLQGKKSNVTRSLLFEYFGRERLGLNERVLSRTESEFKNAFPEWQRLIEISFLSNEKKEAYLELVEARKQRLGVE